MMLTLTFGGATHLSPHPYIDDWHVNPWRPPMLQFASAKQSICENKTNRAINTMQKRKREELQKKSGLQCGTVKLGKDVDRCNVIDKYG